MRRKIMRFGEGAKFLPRAHAEAYSKISIGSNVILQVGNYMFAGPSQGGAGNTIEDNVLNAAGVHLYTDNHQFENPNIPIIEQGYRPTTRGDVIKVRSQSWIGVEVIVLERIEIGETSVVGAGTDVTKSVPRRTIFAGNPRGDITKLDIPR